MSLYVPRPDKHYNKLEIYTEIIAVIKLTQYNFWNTGYREKRQYSQK